MSAALVLASRSPSRRALLAAAGVAHETDAADLDETALIDAGRDAGQDPATLAVTLAEAKARAVAARYPGAWVIGADQILTLGKDLFEKPENIDAARQRLRLLRGRTHYLLNGLALVQDDVSLWHHSDRVSLTMRPFSDALLESYLARHGPRLLESAGAYRLEDEGVQLFERIDGDYFSILGLPLLPLLACLRERGVVAP